MLKFIWVEHYWNSKSVAFYLKSEITEQNWISKNTRITIKIQKLKSPKQSSIEIQKPRTLMEFQKRSILLNSKACINDGF